MRTLCKVIEREREETPVLGSLSGSMDTSETVYDH